MKGQEIVRPIEERLRNNYMDYPNSYYKDTNNKLQNLIGTWIYDDGTNYFKITFFKEKVMENEHYNVFGDKLFTKFLYKKMAGLFMTITVQTAIQGNKGL